MFISYPIVVSLTSFYFFDLPKSSFGSMLDWMFICVLSALAGGFWGFAFGSFMKNEVVATQLNLLFLILFSFGAGFYANTGSGANFVVDAITYISPMRFSTELLMRRALSGKTGASQVLSLLGYTWGNPVCFTLLAFSAVEYFFVGWLCLVYKTHKF